MSILLQGAFVRAMQLRASDHNLVCVEAENHQVSENKHRLMEKPRALQNSNQWAARTREEP